jgi:hypothetical protein
MKKTSILLGLLAASFFASGQTRMSLYEEFTGENCGPCAATNPGLNTLLNANASQVIAIKWQVPIPSAPSTTWSLYQTDKPEIDWRWLAAPSSYGYLCATCQPTANYIDYAPQGRMDGQELNTFGILGPAGSQNHPGYLTAAAISSAQAQPTPFAITITPTYDATYSNATVNIVVASSSTFNAVGALKLRLVLTERAIHFPTAPGSNGEKDFYDAVRKCYVTTPVVVTTSMTDFGTVLPSSWIAAQTQTYSIVCAIPSYINDKSQMAFVTFIQDDGNKMVWQAARSAQAVIANDAKMVSYTMPTYSCANSINPSVNILNQGPNAITAMTIVPVIDGVNQTPFLWAGTLASSASTNIALGTYPASGGAHVVTFNITNVSGGDANTNNNTATGNTALIQTYFAGPVVEPFTNATFPPANWFVVNTDKGASWSRDPSAGFNQAGASKYDFYDNSVVGDADEMYVTPSNLSGMAAPMLSFDVSYAQYNAENDQLEVKVSTDCGATWTSIYNKAGTVLKTVPPYSSGAFIPSSNSQWRNESMPLPASAANNASVLVKFVATSDFGNNLYVDNVNISQNATGIKTQNQEAFSVQLYPNPSIEYTNLDVTTKVAVKASVNVYNAIGQIVIEKSVQLNQGFNNISIDTKSLAAGVYNVVLSSENGNTARKLTVTK